jgi:hypothetical protein
VINVVIDTASIVDAFYLDPKQVDALVDYTAKEMAGRFAVAWEQEAINTLKSSRPQYVRSILVQDEGKNAASVRLVGVLPNMIESGASSYDMKENLLNGPNARTTKSGGKVNVVPFSLGSPDSLGENFNGSILPQEVYDVIKSKPQNKPVAGGGLKSDPLKADEIPKPYNEPQVKSFTEPKSKSFEQYEHKGSIYEGVSRVKDSTTGQNRYESFRAVSSNSAPNSWQHPGLEAQDLASKALSDFNIESNLSSIIDEWLAENM